MRAQIIGTGSYLPKKIVTNDDLSQTLDTSDEWIASRTGIRQRRYSDRDVETCSFMGTEAAKRALSMAQIDASELDLIITATISADQRLPSAACLIQNNLSAINVPAFDLQAACAGSVYGLSIADSFIRSGTYKNILFIASEVMSSVIDHSDRNTAVLFGDAASAAVVTRSETESGFIDFDLYADGRMHDVIYISKPKNSSSDDKSQPTPGKVVMNGRETFKFAVRSMCDAVVKILQDNNIDSRDIAFAVPHQANLRIIEAIAKRLDLSMDRFLINLDMCANTSAASLLLAYDQANRNHQFKKGDLIVMLAIGAGFAWGASLYRV